MAIVMVIVMANRSLCASSSSSSSNTAQWYADSGQLSNAIVTKLCSVLVCVCVCVCDCVGVVGTANGLGFHPHAKRGPTFFQHVSFVLYVCVRVCASVCASVYARACVGAVPKRFHCSTQRRVAASCLVLTTCCCESCCVPSSVLRARNASLDFSLLSL